MVKLKCKKCKYTWEYKGKSKYYASCPMCKHPNKISERRVKKKRRKK